MSNKPNRNARHAGAVARARGTQPDRTPLIVVGAVFAVVLIGVLVVVVTRGATDGASGAGLVFGRVEVEGEALARYPGPQAPDPAVGRAAPLLTGQDFDEAATSVGGEADQPTLLVFLAHWCPHCRAEVPVLVDMDEQGAFEGVRKVAVVTGTDNRKPNFPPKAWLDREGWTGDVLVDTEEGMAAAAFGLEGYPFMVMLDADGTVTGRTSGEKPAAEVAALVATGTAGT